MKKNNLDSRSHSETWTNLLYYRRAYFCHPCLLLELEVDTQRNPRDDFPSSCHGVLKTCPAGAARACTEMATAYAKERVQFGRPIGTFGPVKHHCANMLVATEQATAGAWGAARDDPVYPPIARFATRPASDGVDAYVVARREDEDVDDANER